MNTPNETLRYLGMMSGTSVDGVDAVLVDFSNDGSFELKNSLFQAYPEQIRQRINSLAHQAGELDPNELASLDQVLAEFYATTAVKLLETCQVEPDSITAIANHGQTIKHEPNASPPSSLQLGAPDLIAQLTGIRTLARFRQKDLEVGGQGAPLMPAFHEKYLRSDIPRVVLNIGGIANITVLSEQTETPTFGFDTGPGNTLMDQWVFENQGIRYDENGNWARTGKSIPALLGALLAEHYFQDAPPKSTGPDYFNLDWLRSKADSIDIDISACESADVQATLLELSARSIARAIEHFAPETREIIICGGGAHNQFLLQRLMDVCDDKITSIVSSDAIGFPADWMEALGFAWLGYCYDSRLSSNLPSVTGAKQKVVLGEEFLVI